MFYFGLCSDGHARDGVALSNDLMHWRKGDSILVDVGPEGSIDSRYAHKPGIICRGKTLYHFYCAAAPANGTRLGEIEYDEVRGIAVATSGTECAAARYVVSRRPYAMDASPISGQCAFLFRKSVHQVG